MDNNEWLNDLKVGDKVFVITEQYGSRSRALKKVEKITPTKQIVINNIHYKNGFAPRGGTWITTTMYLEQATIARLNDYYNLIYAQKVLAKIKNVNAITYEQAQKIMDIMGWQEV